MLNILKINSGWLNKCLCICLLVGLSNVSLALSAREVMEKVDALQRQANDSTFTISKLTSCKFAKQGKKVACVSSPRVKRLESVSKQYGEHKKDSRGVSVVLGPASDKGIGMLTYSYDDDSKDAESWLYLSALGKVKRMVSSGDDKEPVAFFGSEFTTGDMESGKTDEYEYKILQEGKYTNRQVWVIEAIPNIKRAKTTGYSKVLMWIDQEKFITLKAQPYDKHGKTWKRILASKIENIKGLWLARNMKVYNLKTKRMSKLTTEQITLGLAIDDDYLTQRTLTDFAFREKSLSRLRAAAK
jgi:hypothetical protein